MDANSLPDNLPDDLFAHLLRLAAVARPSLSPIEICRAMACTNADDRVADALIAMSPAERQDALDGAASLFLLPAYAARAADLAARRLEREFRLDVAPRRPRRRPARG